MDTNHSVDLHNSETPIKRPLGVTIFAWLTIIGSLLTILTPIVVSNFHPMMHQISAHLNWMYFVSFAQSLIMFICAFFLFKRKEWARKLFLIMTMLGFIYGVGMHVFSFNETIFSAQHDKTKSVFKNHMSKFKYQADPSDESYLLFDDIEKDFSIAMNAGLESQNMLSQFWGLGIGVLWIWFVFVYFNRKDVRACFRKDSALDKGSRIFVRGFALIVIVSLLMQSYLTIIEKHQMKYLDNGQQLLTEGKHAAAMEMWAKGLDIPPGHPALHYARGQQFYIQKNYDEALNEFNRAIALEKHDPELLLMRAKAYFKMKKYDLAISDLDKTLELDPVNEEALYATSYIHLENNQYELARQNAQNVISLNPNHYDAHTILGKFYIIVNRD